MSTNDGDSSGLRDYVFNGCVLLDVEFKYVFLAFGCCAWVFAYVLAWKDVGLNIENGGAHGDCKWKNWVIDTIMYAE